MKNNPYESFYHGLVSSKLWLCEELEKILANNKQYTVHVLGGWHNLMSFMLIIRRPHQYKELHSYDIDQSAITVADQICDTWKFEEPKVYNHIKDAGDIEYGANPNDIIINCSLDQMQTNHWFDKIPKGKLVCIQTTDQKPDSVDWHIAQYTPSLEALIAKFPNLSVWCSGEKTITYGSWGYKRLMVIGFKT